MGCLDCVSLEKQKRMKEYENTLTKINQEYADRNGNVWVAIVRTKNGIIGYREYGHESLARLEVLEYVLIMEGVVLR